MKRHVLRWLYAATALVTLLAGASLLVPDADAALYSAGTLRPRSMICRCPVLTGDCVCEYQ